MQDEHWAGDRPTEEQIGVVAVRLVRGNAMGTHFEPVGDVAAHVGPEKAAFDAV
jgi:hypothetical protein